MKLGYLEPRLRIEGLPSAPRLVNTTGDIVDPKLSIIQARASSEFGQDDKGESFVSVTRGDTSRWIPTSAFQSTAGPDGVLYLPTYRDSSTSAALSGGLRSAVAMHAIGLTVGGGAAGALGGLAGTLVPTENRALQLATGASVGAAAMIVTGVLCGHGDMPVLGYLGAISGLTGTLAGAGQGKVRDSLYGGTLVGLTIGLATGNPLAMLTGASAAALGAQANGKAAQMVTGALAGAGIAAVQSAITGNHAGIAIAVSAAAGALGPLVGPVLMQLSRNLASDGTAAVQKRLAPVIARCSDTQVKALGGLPFAATGALMGSVAVLVSPAWQTAGIVAGSLVGGAVGVYQTHQLVERLKAAQNYAPR